MLRHSAEIRLVKTIIAASVLWSLAAMSSMGQSLPDDELPAPPPAGFSDEGGVLGKGSDAERRLAGMIDVLRRERGYQVFVIIHRSLISSNPNDMAAQLQQEWLPSGGGLVVVFESDTRELGFGRSLDAGEVMTTGGADVPSYELVKIIVGALAEAERKEGIDRPEIYMVGVVAEICLGIETYFARKEAPAESGRSLRLALITVGFLSLLTLCGMGLGWLIARSDRRQSETRVFPETNVPERLGAPYGGGCGASGSFGQARKEIG